MSLSQDAKTIFSALDLALISDTPTLIGRNGSTELGSILSGEYNEVHMNCAGIWPENLYNSWRLDAVEATLAADVLATGWYRPLAEAEADLLEHYHFNGAQICLKALEPYYVDAPLRWTKLLADQKVAVISPFAELCIKQYERRKEIWPADADTLLPDNINFISVKTGFTPIINSAIINQALSWPSNVTNYEDAVDYIVAKVIASQAKIAIIGCGGLGMLIACKLKLAGISSIVMGGALQVLFGIKGQRWVQTPIEQFWNAAWVWPPITMKPVNAHLIEGGCYW